MRNVLYHLNNCIAVYAIEILSDENLIRQKLGQQYKVICFITTTFITADKTPRQLESIGTL